MAPKYKLIYFNGRGRAEAIRWLLAYMEEDYEDVRIESGDWLKMKHTTPFEQLPLLEEDGKPTCQSLAIVRYLAKKAGLAGDNDWENLQLDIVSDALVDLRSPVTTFMRETNEDLKRTKKETYIKETIPFYMKKLDTLVKENGGYLANKKLSWVDFLFVSSVVESLNLICGVPDITADYPNLHALTQKILDIPQIKQWVAKRPSTAF
uniref:glutathione transferase n=1 Tax=Graphocephala atropunctata TaxID=36148 RepID=A0A1B6MVD0_9HEMI